MLKYIKCLVDSTQYYNNNNNNDAIIVRVPAVFYMTTASVTGDPTYYPIPSTAIRLFSKAAFVYLFSTHPVRYPTPVHRSGKHKKKQ
jgi:hypothetical protein